MEETGPLGCGCVRRQCSACTWPRGAAAGIPTILIAPYTLSSYEYYTAAPGRVQRGALAPASSRSFASFSSPVLRTSDEKLES